MNQDLKKRMSVPLNPNLNQQIRATSSTDTYDFSNAVFENGAILYLNYMAVNIGGPNDGSATLQVYVNQQGEYNLNIQYLGANKHFKIDINGVSTGTTYITQGNNQGEILIKVNLRARNNIIKFHGNSPEYGPSLMRVIINLNNSQPSTYNLVNGVLRSGVVINRAKNMVTGIGGANRGEVTINVTAIQSGYYSININFNMGLRPFLLDVNRINTGQTYIVPAELDGQYYLEVNLNTGVNQLKFYGLNTNLAPNLGEFVLSFINNPSPPSDYYSLAKGVIRNGARLNSIGNLVEHLGGPQNGSSTVNINVTQAGNYNLEVEFEDGSKLLKLDVNRVNVNSTLMTPAGTFGKFTTVINLRVGTNEIKFYGDTSEYASKLGVFKLNFIPPIPNPILPQGTYDPANGLFEYGADLDINTNFVTSLGGPNDGKVTVNNVRVTDAGMYNVKLKYLSADPNRFLSIDVNGTTSGIFDIPVTGGWNLTDVQILDFEISLLPGNNQIVFHGDLINLAPMIGTFELTRVTTPAIASSYTFVDLNALSYTELLNILKRIRWDQITGLFEFSNDSYDFYNDSNRVQAIIDELGRSGQSFTTQNEQGIDTLVEVLRAGFYLGYNNQQLSNLNDIAYKNKCLPSIRIVLNNTNFRLGTSTQDKVVFAIAKLIGNASADVGIINRLSNVLMAFENNLVQYSTSRDKNNAVYKIMSEISGFLSKEKFRNRNLVQNTAFYGNIDSFLNRIESLAQKGLNFSVDADWLVNNFIHFSAKLSDFRTNTTITHQVLSNCLNIYSYLSKFYLETLKELQNKFNGTLANGNSIDYDDKINQAKARYLSNEYKFDNDSIIIKTGNMVAEEKVKRLYWASKEVKAQFMRITNNDIPLDTGSADDVLTIVLYNSPNEYKLNRILYGFSVDNGGIYIESIGTFFTYERTIQQSIFSLEELFRHEYVHYLEGRYLVPGIWGRSSFYQGIKDRLAWFAEGIGEFFAGATRKQNVQPRVDIVRELASNRNRLSASEVLNAKYGSFNFYSYACAFAYYMYTRQLNQFLELVRLLKSNDVSGYDNYISYLSNDTLTNSLYEQTIDDLVANLSNYSTPEVSDDYLIRHPNMNINQIQNDIITEMPMSGVLIDTLSSDFYQTFTLTGVCDNGVSVDETSDWQAINTRLNTVLEDLERRQWSGYKTVTAYFTNYRVNPNGHTLFNIVFHGILRVL